MIKNREQNLLQLFINSTKDNNFVPADKPIVTLHLENGLSKVLIPFEFAGSISINSVSPARVYSGWEVVKLTVFGSNLWV